MHQVAEDVREYFLEIDKLIDKIKQTFLNASSRINIFFK